MIIDSNGHEWVVNNGEHPFLTGWRCSGCGEITTTSDGMVPSDMPKSKKNCPNARVRYNKPISPDQCVNKTVIKVSHESGTTFYFHDGTHCTIGGQ